MLSGRKNIIKHQKYGRTNQNSITNVELHDAWMLTSRYVLMTKMTNSLSMKE